MYRRLFKRKTISAGSNTASRLIKLWLATLVYAASAIAAETQEVDVCYNYGCNATARIVFKESELRNVQLLFSDVQDAHAERYAISQAIGMLAIYAGMQSPIFRDRGKNDQDEGINGKMDCIDHSRNATAYLRLLQHQGWLKFHQVQAPIKRAPWLVNDHWAAHITETFSQQGFVVDSWFFDNGYPAAIFKLNDWISGASPK